MFYVWVLRSIEANHKTQELQLLRPIFFLLLVTGIGSTQKMTTMANPEHKVLQSDVWRLQRKQKLRPNDQSHQCTTSDTTVDSSKVLTHSSTYIRSDRCVNALSNALPKDSDGITKLERAETGVDNLSCEYNWHLQHNSPSQITNDQLNLQCGIRLHITNAQLQLGWLPYLVPFEHRLFVFLVLQNQYQYHRYPLAHSPLKWPPIWFPNVITFLSHDDVTNISWTLFHILIFICAHVLIPLLPFNPLTCLCQPTSILTWSIQECSLLIQTQIPLHNNLIFLILMHGSIPQQSMYTT